MFRNKGCKKKRTPTNFLEGLGLRGVLHLGAIDGAKHNGAALDAWLDERLTIAQLAHHSGFLKLLLEALQRLINAFVFFDIDNNHAAGVRSKGAKIQLSLKCESAFSDSFLYLISL